jgi:molybdate transport repressor ModE-like protein
MDKELHLKLTVRLYTDDSQRCFGPGIATLLSRVREHHSLRSAAASMGMAYSKAWRIIHTAEDLFGCKLLSSTIGGRNGGGAVLTDQAERLLAAYDSYVADIEAYSLGKFQEAFGFYRELSAKGPDQEP